MAEQTEEEPKKTSPPKSLLDFVGEKFHGSSAEGCVKYVLQAELDELAKHQKTHTKFLEQAEKYNNWQRIHDAKLSTVGERDRIVQDEKADAGKRIREMEAQQAELESARLSLENQRVGAEWMKRNFGEIFRRGSAFVFHMDAREKHLEQKVKEMEQRRNKKRRATDQTKRRTPGRKQRANTMASNAFLKARDELAVPMARRIPRLNPQPKTMSDKSSGITWHNARRIFKNGPNEGDLHLGVDSDNKIVKRIVQKTVDARVTWRLPCIFRGDLNGKGSIYPLEWLTHSLASNADGGARSILPVLGTGHVNQSQKSYRMCVQYAACRDLNDVAWRYERRGQSIPTPFLYFVFKSVVDACLIMKQGSSTANSPVKDWTEEIVHRDLKPDNVFLDLPDPDHFPIYPQPKVADFGLAFLTSAEDQTNPAYWANAVGTKGYMPPEQIPFEDPLNRKAVDDFKILSDCNVWGIGAIMLKLLDPKFNIESNQPTYCPGRSFGYVVPDRLQNIYPRDLCLLVDDCLYHEPEHRVTLEVLQQEIARLIEQDLYMRNASAGQRDVWRDGLYKLLYADEDGYLLGMTYEPPQGS
ncbi:hypothetical protein M409DRAFT_19835 [Zasmidium cellare ATCC 36951]|uniref:non-specific serine/threonine protein kinase n=1 Tax=Zasmidium cellare ATCC 36951 TaxID=1080233 RepID=A0A6A6CU43_ZASCE|nr:uncharacterized protein M409DRAFT_19835 [Zasmidium cellare ATCC 36951]KAF2170233.1 hypothetical protein M409DRAFT_19835 [Zasmidium cellare ATCC 36951]